MKNKILIMVIGFLLVGTIVAVTLTTREEAISNFISENTTRGNLIRSSVNTIVYTSPKICSPIYGSGEIKCKVHLNFTVGEYTFEEVLGFIPEEATQGEIDNMAEKYVLQQADRYYPRTSYEWEENLR